MTEDQAKEWLRSIAMSALQAIEMIDEDNMREFNIILDDIESNVKDLQAYGLTSKEDE